MIRSKRSVRQLLAAAIAALSLVALAACGSPEEKSVHFTAAGDIGLGEGAVAVLDTVAELKPDFNIALGDFPYEPGADQKFCDMVTGKLGAEFAYQLLPGNHESDGSDGDIEKLAACLPNRLPGLQGDYAEQWYVDVPQEEPLARIIVVSPGIEFPDGKLDYSKDSERWNWTEKAIDGARTENIPWTIVAMHTPCFTMGRYACAAGEALTNMLIEKKVDLVLSGHEHLYQRTHQLGFSDRCDYMRVKTVEKRCVVDTGDSMTQGRGTVFVTVGIGGRTPREINIDDPESHYFASWSAGNHNSTLGTLDVTATDTRMDLKLVPADGYTFSDSFSIRK